MELTYFEREKLRKFYLARQQGSGSHGLTEQEMKRFIEEGYLQPVGRSVDVTDKARVALTK
jgi:hypothetical protein